MKKSPRSQNRDEEYLDSEAELFVLHADTCKVFSHPARLAILNALRDEDLSVSEIAERARVSVSTASQHLSVMKERHIVSARKEGNRVFYRLANPKMVEAFDLIREILYEQIEKQSRLVEEATRPAGAGRRPRQRKSSKKQ